MKYNEHNLTLSNIKGNVSMTLDKLSGIRGDLVRNDKEWVSWDFIKLTDAVTRWARRKGERRKILARKGLCFNCATKPHRAANCTSKSACGHCSKRHHTSICDQNTGSKTDKHVPPDELMTDGDSGEGIFLVVVIKVYGLTFLRINKLRRQKFLRFCEKRPAN